VDIQPPDLETRLAILQVKAQKDDILVPDDVLEFIASKFDQSVRELEGALVRVVAWSELTRSPIDIELADRALQDLLPQNEAEIPPQLILDETASYFGLSRDDLVSPTSRSRTCRASSAGAPGRRASEVWRPWGHRGERRGIVNASGARLPVLHTNRACRRGRLRCARRRFSASPRALPLLG
jgi:hypothetical protein